MKNLFLMTAVIFSSLVALAEEKVTLKCSGTLDGSPAVVTVNTAKDSGFQMVLDWDKHMKFVHQVNVNYQDMESEVLVFARKNLSEKILLQLVVDPNSTGAKLFMAGTFGSPDLKSNDFVCENP